MTRRAIPSPLKTKGFMLIELILAVLLLGFIVATASLYGKYIGIIQRDVDKNVLMSMSKLGSGLEYMVQRILHSDNDPIVSIDGKDVKFDVIYAGKKRTARIYHDDATKEVLYDYNIDDSTPAKVFLTAIESLKFIEEVVARDADGNPTEERLGIEIEAMHEESYPIKLRTSLVGRNRINPKAIIN